MVRKLWALILTAALLLCTLPITGLAATQKEVEALRKSARQSYLYSLRYTGRGSFSGYCGLMVSYQMWHLDIIRELEIYDGNEQFDAYMNLPETTSGYHISAYSAKEYSLKEALMEISRGGTRDVYNLLVGFQWTTTAAGRRYGHTCFINGILNGKVYYVESFYTSLGGYEGTVIECSIDEFVNYYAAWTRFEGIIWFDGTDYASTCTQYGTDIFVRTRFDMPLRSQPCLVGKEDCQVLRSVTAGERLHVTGVVKNTEGELFYRVVDGDQVGYIVAQAAVLEQINAQEIQLKDYIIPETISKDAMLPVSGTVMAANGLVGAVEVVVTDQEGNVVLQQRSEIDKYAMVLSDFVGRIDMDGLKQGKYTVQLYAETASTYVREGELDQSCATILLDSRDLWIGKKTDDQQTNEQLHQFVDGWNLYNGVWYLYQGGAPWTGWYTERGVKYYLKDDGSVTTGWAEVDGLERYFTENGAMSVGWLSTSEGMRYSFEDGTFAEGWQIIGTGRYYFEKGYMKTSGTKKDGAVTYRFESDGRAVAVVK